MLLRSRFARSCCNLAKTRCRLLTDHCSTAMWRCSLQWWESTLLWRQCKLREWESTLQRRKTCCNDEQTRCNDEQTRCNEEQIRCNDEKTRCNDGKATCNGGKQPATTRKTANNVTDILLRSHIDVYLTIANGWFCGVPKKLISPAYNAFTFAVCRFTIAFQPPVHRPCVAEALAEAQALLPSLKQWQPKSLGES